MPLNDDIEFHLVQSIDEAMEMKRWISENRRDVIGLDTETSGLNPYAPGARLRMVQLGDHRHGWAVPWEQWGGVALECLNAWDGPLAVHNLAFDAKWLKHHAGWEVPWHRTHDTMIMYNMMFPGQMAGLKYVTDKHIDPRASVGEDILKKAFKDNGWDWNTVPIDFEAFALYSAMDPVLAAHIWEFLRADQVYPESYDLEMSVLRICNTMEDNGIPVDVDFCIENRDKLEEYVEKSKKWAETEFGVKIGSPAALGRYFERELNAPIVKRTATGLPSVDKETLGAFAKQGGPVGQFAQFVLDVREADKIRGSYMENFINDQTDGLLHPNIKTLRAVTGRMSITNPALQTLGKSGAHNVVRSAITAREGEVLASADLDQVEFRVFAHLSQDENLIQTFLGADETGGDVFTTIGAQVYGEPDFQKSDNRRGLIKNVIYGRLYGASVKKQAQSAGVSYESMQAVSDALDEQYPGIRRYQKTNDAIVNGRLSSEGQAYIKTLVTDRKIPVEADRIYSGLNYTIQSSAAEVFKMNLVKIDAAGLTSNLIIPVHDEIVFSGAPEDIEDMKQTVRECMTTRDGWSVPLTSDAEGPYQRWGDKYKK